MMTHKFNLAGVMEPFNQSKQFLKMKKPLHGKQQWMKMKSPGQKMPKKK